MLLYASKESDVIDPINHSEVQNILDFMKKEKEERAERELKEREERERKLKEE